MARTALPTSGRNLRALATVHRGAPLYDQVAQNKRRAVMLAAGYALSVFVVTALVLLLIGLGIVGVVLALVVAACLVTASYLESDALVLRLSRAQPASPEQYPRLHNLVENLCASGGVAKPRLFVVDDDAPNAFATGRNPRHAAVAVTTGLLDRLTRVELEGVLAHELSHIRNDDVGLCTLAVTMVGGLTALSDVGIRRRWWNGGRTGHDDPAPAAGAGGRALASVSNVALAALAPVAGPLMRAVVGWRRQSLADLTGVGITRYPPGLIAALEKLEHDDTIVHASSRATEHLWLCQPLARTDDEGQLARVNRYFDTHPPLEERIAALREL